MKGKHLFGFLVLSLVLSCCTQGIDQKGSEKGINWSDESTLESQAEVALTDFHKYLNQSEYAKASAFYGGTYENLLNFNPTLSEEDKEHLLQAACEFNGFMCLDVLSAELIEVYDQGEFIYEVKFANPDGSEFILGPCCGASEDEMPPKSFFIVHVHCENDSTCLVLDLPPYVP